jgi:hypothetical protein
VLAHLVPREMKVEHSQSLKSMQPMKRREFITLLGGRGRGETPRRSYTLAQPADY